MSKLFSLKGNMQSGKAFLNMVLIMIDNGKKVIFAKIKARKS